MNRYQSERRRFLKMVGASALTYPFLRGVPSFAAGADPGNPMYMVLLYTSCGCVRPMWGAYGPPATGASAVVTPLSSSAGDGGVGGFRPTLSAFKKAGPMGLDLTDQMIVLDGINNAAADCGSHEPGMSSLWTGAPIINGSNSTGPSIDQAIAAQLAMQGIKPSLPSIQLYAASACDEQTRGVHNRMLYGPPAANGVCDYIDPNGTTPSDAMSALFPSVMAADAGPNAKLLIRGQVQNQVNSELKSLSSRLCYEDRSQLQTLQTMWNDAETQIAASAAAAAGCMRPSFGTQPAGDPFGSPATCSTANDPLPFNIAAMSNILAMALACDLTRVASLQMSQALSPAVHDWLPSVVAAGGPSHHTLSHGGPSYIGQILPSNCNQTAPNYCGADPLYYITPAQAATLYPQALIDIDAWYATQVATFAALLASTQSKVSGKSVLDLTMICWGSELDMGAYHNHDDTPFVIIGGKGTGKLNNGNLIRFPLNINNQYSTQGNHPPTNNRFHNDLLVTLAQAMGVTVSGLGGMPNTFGATTMPGAAFQGSSTIASLTLNQGAIKEILAPA
jgi:hypothetical protein